MPIWLMSILVLAGMASGLLAVILWMGVGQLVKPFNGSTCHTCMSDQSGPFSGQRMIQSRDGTQI